MSTVTPTQSDSDSDCWFGTPFSVAGSSVVVVVVASDPFPTGAGLVPGLVSAGKAPVVVVVVAVVVIVLRQPDSDSSPPLGSGIALRLSLLPFPPLRGHCCWIASTYRPISGISSHAFDCEE